MCKYCERDNVKFITDMPNIPLKVSGNVLENEDAFKDLEGIEHKLKFAWFLSPGLKELKEYFANYKKVNRLQQIDKCKDDIERYKKWILESEETLKKLEEDEELS